MERLFLEERIGMIPMRGLAKLQDPCILLSIYEPSEIHREYYKFDAASMAESGEACVMRTEHNDRFLKVVFSRSESSAASYNVTVQFNGEVYAMQWKPCGLRNQKIIAADGWSVQLTDRMLE